MADKRKVAIGVGIVGVIAGAGYLLSKRAAPPPPEPDKATLWGIVTDTSDPKKKIKDIAVACGGYFASTDGNGRYEMPNIEPGIYAVTFTDPLGRYEPLTV